MEPTENDAAPPETHMRRTATETPERTIATLITAMDRQHPVTITYTRTTAQPGDPATIRTIEIYDFDISTAGDIRVVAMDRETGERRDFRISGISAYTVHRTSYTVPRDTDTDTAADTATARKPRTTGLAAATARYATIHLLPATTPERATDVLANLLLTA